MEKSVYVIKLYSKNELVKENRAETTPGPNCGQDEELPSEQRYSSSLVLGLGIVHICLGSLSAIFALTALFIEPQPNRYASGLWTGLIYIGTGFLGVLAHWRWYAKHQILYFLLASILAFFASVAAIVLTSYGIHLTIQRNLFLINNYYLMNSRRLTSANKKGSLVTANIFIVSFFELVWSLLSIFVAVRGTKNQEFEFEHSSYKRKAKKECRHYREFLLNAKLPPGYSAQGILANPDFLCHLSVPSTGQYQVSRANPLVWKKSKYTASSQEVNPDNSEVGTIDMNTDDYFPSMSSVPSKTTLTTDEKVQFFLNQSVKLACENSFGNK